MEETLQPLSPEQFASVWSRVAPEGSGGIVVKASDEQEAPAFSCPVHQEQESLPFLEERLRMEAHFRQSLFRLGRCAQPLTRQARSREQRLSSALFLLTGGWCHPELPKHCRELRRSQLIRELYHESCQMEQEYRRMAEHSDDLFLCPLCVELANEHHMTQQQLRTLLEQR